MTEIITNPWLFAAASGIGGAILTLGIGWVVGKRSLFTYNVWHDRVAVSTDDASFGSVTVLWDGKPVPNLFLSTVELRNESLRDFTDVEVRVWSSTTRLLNERSEIVGTTQRIYWSEEYSALLLLPENGDATETQLQLWNSQRDYLIPAMNRGQVVRVSILNSAPGPAPPNIWLETLHPGVKVQFRTVPQQFMGVPQPAAALTGTLAGILVVALIATLVDSVPLAAILAFLYGIVCMIPGAILLRSWRWVREALGD